MKKTFLLSILAAVVTLLGLTAAAYSQVFEDDFESWTTGGIGPWDSTSAQANITISTTTEQAHSGSASMKCYDITAKGVSKRINVKFTLRKVYFTLLFGCAINDCKQTQISP